MADRVQEQLLGYLLGALDDSEQEQLSRQLEEDPALQRKLARARKSLRVLRSSRPEFTPSPGLAARTCQFVAQCRERQRTAVRPAPAVQMPVMSPTQTPPVGTSSWGWADLAVAVGICAAAFLLLFPAIENSRFHSQLAACQDNLRQLGIALAHYSHRHEEFLPQVPGTGELATAGIHTPLLLQHGFLTDARRAVCPTSPQARDPRFQSPSWVQLARPWSPEELTQLRAVMGASYGYSLGSTEGGRSQSSRNLQRSSYALLADSPSDSLPHRQSLNHGAHGQNVLFEDCRVGYFVTGTPNSLIDDFFVNDAGRVAAGNQRDDSVIGSGNSVPVILVGTGAP